jgi:hypothetical protein
MFANTANQTHIFQLKEGIFVLDLPSCKTMYDFIYGSMRFPDAGRGLRSLFILGTFHMWKCLALYRMWMSFMRRFFNAHVPLKRSKRRPLVNRWYNAFFEKSIVDRGF